MGTNSLYSDIINDLWSLHLSMIGVIVSVMTLIFSSLSSKVEELKAIENLAKSNDIWRPTTISNIISRYKKLNRKLKCILISTTFLFVISFVLKYLPINFYSIIAILLDALLTIGLLIWIAIVAVGVYKEYQVETKKAK